VAVNDERCDAEQLLREATQAMHVAKRAGGNGLEVFRPENHTRSVERLRLENALHRAIENRELELLFQPIFDMQQKLEGFEALLKWHHPAFGVVPPSVFIPIAEENGFIVELGAWVMRQACSQGASWRHAGLRGIRLSVNVSARELENAEYGKILAKTLAATGFPPDCLELELTESSIVRDLPGSADRMAALRGLGLSIAIDDFGTGYSSLSYLSKLPVDTLKLDQSFIRDITEGASLSVIHGIVRLAHGMHLTVVAEGVETHDQLELIRVVGCDRVQGSLCGHSLSAHEAEELLSRRNSSSCTN
jgi:EAL domain-containing protein (putative c-di-GMP-specific phosphodiesterase class I)